MKIEVAPFGENLYQQAVQLRTLILRKPLQLTYTANQLEEEKDQIHIVAVENGEVQGVVLMQFLDDKTVKMRQLAVKDKYQGQGIGSELVSFFEDYAIEKGYANIVLHARERAVKFYKQLDYERVGEGFKEVTLNHYKMVKSLED